MKVSILLITLGFSQVLGRNYGSLTESKSEREDQIEGKSSEDNNIEYGSTACRIFKRAVQNWNYFYLKINILKGNY